jgi:hypothetical protein
MPQVFAPSRISYVDRISEGGQRMKLKALLLVMFAAAGTGASIAVADNGNGNGQGDNNGCRALHISGTVAPQTFVITVSHPGKNGPATGSTVTVTIGGAGQTVRANVGECTSAGGTGTTTTSSTMTVRSIDLRAFQTQTTETTTGKHGDDDAKGDNDKDDQQGGTTTSTTTTSHS